MTPEFDASDYQQAMIDLLPRGRIWRNAEQAAVLGALAPTYARSSAAAIALVADTLPTTTDNLLPEWEQSLGLPDHCSPPSPTIDQRKAAVAAKWASRGGQSQAYFVKLAVAFGYEVTIRQFSPFRIGSKVGTPLWGRDWAFAWQVDSAETLDVYMQCRIRQAAPAHTTVMFNFIP